MPKTIPALSLSFNDQQQIRQWLTAHGTPQEVALRGRVGPKSVSVHLRELGHLPGPGERIAATTVLRRFST